MASNITGFNLFASGALESPKKKSKLDENNQSILPRRFSFESLESPKKVSESGSDKGNQYTFSRTFSSESPKKGSESPGLDMGDLIDFSETDENSNNKGTTYITQVKKTKRVALPPFEPFSFSSSSSKLFAPMNFSVSPNSENFGIKTCSSSSSQPPKIIKGLAKGHTGSEGFIFTVESQEQTEARLLGLKRIGEGVQSVVYVNESKTEVFKYIKLYSIHGRAASKRRQETVNRLLTDIESNYHHLKKEGLSVAPILNAHDSSGAIIKGQLVRDQHVCAPYLPSELKGEDLLKKNIQGPIKALLEHPYSKGGIRIDFNIDNLRISYEGDVFLIDVDNEAIKKQYEQDFSIDNFIKKAFIMVKEQDSEKAARNVVRFLVSGLPREIQELCLPSPLLTKSESKSG